MSFVIDSFTEASDLNLASHTGEVGAGWTDHPHINYGSIFSINAASDRIFSTGTAAYYSNVVPPSADYSVEADFFLHSAISQNIAICARMDTTADTMIIVRLNNGTTWELREIVATVASTLGSSTNQLPTAGTSKRGKLVVQGNQAWFFVEGVLEIGPVTVTVTDAGRAGVRNAGVASATTGIHLDNLTADSINASVSLFRGRNFLFFDDEEVNRFEFWPAIAAGGAEHERSALVDASGDVSLAGESFSVFERTADVSATGSIETSAQFLSVAERSVAIDAAGSTEVSGSRDIQRSSAITATAAIESSAIFFSVFDRSSLVDGIGSVTVSGTRIVERSLSLAAAGSINSTAQSFSTSERSVEITATATVQSATQFFTTFERAAILNASSTITVSGNAFSTVERAISHSAAATIETSAESFTPWATSISLDATGFVDVSGARELNRSTSITASGSVETAAEFVTIFERAATLNGAGAISISDQRDLLRDVALSTIGNIDASGAAASAISIVATGAITVSGEKVLRIIKQPTSVRLDTDGSSMVSVYSGRSGMTLNSGESNTSIAS